MFFLLCLEKRILLFLLFLFPTLAFSQEVKFNNNYAVACHNCYEKKLATDFQDVFTYTKTIEIDIWNENFGLGLIANFMGKSMSGDWYVKHKPHQRGNKNNVGGSFRDYLLQLKSWSDDNSGHDIITVFIDKKQNWNNWTENKTPADLDNLLLSVFPREMIFTPAKLLQKETSLKKAAYTNWPPLDSLKGKFVFVITDGTFLTTRSPLQEYLKMQKKDAVCFVSPRIVSENEIYKPRGLSKEAAQNVVFYNLKEAHHNLAEKINVLECITRVYGPAKKESYDHYEQLVNQKVNFVAFYNYKVSKNTGTEQREPKKQTTVVTGDYSLGLQEKD